MARARRRLRVIPVDPDGGPGPGVPLREGPVDLDGERDEPPPAVRDTVADTIRAVPAASRRASLRVDSWVRMTPSRGQVTGVPMQLIAPVLNRNEFRHLPRFLNREAQPLALALALL